MSQTSKLNKLLLDGFPWPPELKPMTSYARLHDDHDGTFQGRLAVTITPDGDAWVWTDQQAGSSLRFRTKFGGGGRSPRVNNAFRILGLAIALDNKDRPDPE